MGAAPHPALRATFPRRVKASAAAGKFVAAPKGSPEGGAFMHLSVSRAKPPPSGEVDLRSKDGEGSARLRQAALPPQRRAFAESGAANATSHYDPTRENAKPERPQTLRLCSIKNNLSAIYAQSSAARISNRPAPGKPLFRLGVIAQHPMTRAQFPPRGGRGSVIVHGGVVDQQLFLPLPARVRHGNGGQ